MPQTVLGAGLGLVLPAGDGAHSSQDGDGALALVGHAGQGGRGGEQDAGGSAQAHRFLRRVGARVTYRLDRAREISRPRPASHRSQGGAALFTARNDGVRFVGWLARRRRGSTSSPWPSGSCWSWKGHRSPPTTTGPTWAIRSR